VQNSAVHSNRSPSSIEAEPDLYNQAPTPANTITRLQANTPLPDKDPLLGLTGLRAFAALWVVLFHLFSLAGPAPVLFTVGNLSVDFTPLLSAGSLGVDLFFVLSGFLLSLPYLTAAAEVKPYPAFAPYCWRRVKRVFPAYLTQLAILAICFALVPYSRLVPLKTWLLHLVMWQGVSTETEQMINGVSWTLPIEFGFYLLLPLLTVILCRRWVGRPGYWILLWLVWAIANALFEQSHWSLDSSSVRPLSQVLRMFDIFLAGIATAALYLTYRSTWQQRPRLANALSVIGLLGFVGVGYALHGHIAAWWAAPWAFPMRHLFCSLFAACLILALGLGSTWGNALFSSRSALWLGTISYSLYLWHLPVLAWLTELLHELAPTADKRPVLLTLGVGLCVGVSALNYHITERPFLLNKAGQAPPRRGLIGVLLLCLAAALAVFSYQKWAGVRDQNDALCFQQSPWGRATIDTVQMAQQSVSIVGWALIPSQQQVWVELNDALIGKLKPGNTRLDVAKAYPMCHQARYAGFEFELAAQSLPAENTIKLVVVNGVNRQVLFISAWRKPS
jgi:peptidoglycan/LPS O-acetylase OafA/YrhL